MSHRMACAIDLPPLPFRQEYNASNLALNFLPKFDTVSPVTCFLSQGEDGFPIVKGDGYTAEFGIEESGGGKSLVIRVDADSEPIAQGIWNCIQIVGACIIDGKVRDIPVKETSTGKTAPSLKM